MNNPIYKIHGVARRKLKKELRCLKQYVKDFWYCHQLDNDMTSLYGGKDRYSMSYDEAQKRVDEAKKKIQEIESRLTIS